MKKYIPKTKEDIQAIEYLKNCSFDVVKSDVPSLLEWLQDLHWDVSHGVAEYLIPYINEIKNDLLYILNSDDNEWKYNILAILIGRSSSKLNQELLLMLKRIAEHPTRGEIEAGVDERARKIIANYL